MGEPSLAPRVINMWSGPRNISTAFMYSWRQRPDTLVFDEPFYGMYLQHHDPGHPGMDEVLATANLDYASILATITAPDPEHRLRYIKNIGHHLDGVDRGVLDLFENVLLIRHPEHMVASISATIGDDFPIDITGMLQLDSIADHELAAGRTPIVVDSHDLLTDPPAVLQRLCARLEIDWDDRVLSWPVGPKPEDGVWGKHWYHSAHRSSEFGPPRNTTRALSIKEQQIVDGCLPAYDRLRQWTV